MTNLAYCHLYNCVALVKLLDEYGIAASSGSACTAGASEASHVLLSIGLDWEMAGASLRLTINEYNTYEDVEYVLKVLPEAVDRLRYI